MREVIEGKMVSKRGPGRPRIGMLDELLERDTYGNMKRRAEDRTGWRDRKPWICQMAALKREIQYQCTYICICIQFSVKLRAFLWPFNLEAGPFLVSLVVSRPWQSITTTFAYKLVGLLFK